MTWIEAARLWLMDEAPGFAFQESLSNLASGVMIPDYWAAHYALTRGIKEALDESGIEIPFPQRTIHQAAA